MFKRIFSFAAAGMLLMAGSGSAFATPAVVIGPTGLSGDLVINNFRPGYSSTSCGVTSDICFSLSNLSGNLGGLPSVTAYDQSTPGTLSLLAPNTDLKFYYSPPLTTDVKLVQLSWNNATSAIMHNGSSVSSLDLLSASVGDSFSVNYSGGWSLFGNSMTGAGNLLFTVYSTSSNGVQLKVTDGTVGPVTFTQALIAFDSIGDQNNLGTINGRFVIPEPDTLALMSLGVLGLFFARREKTA